MKKRTFLLSCVLLAFLQAADAHEDECVADGDEVTFTGIISRQTFPGPPNYESIDDGDTAETYWFVTIDDPMCVRGLSYETAELFNLGELRKFQLVLSREQYTTNRTLLYERAVVKGRLFTGVTGHHHTKALINVLDLKPVQSSSPTTWGRFISQAKALEIVDRKALVMMVRGYIKVKLERLGGALNKGGEDRSWAMKTISIADGWTMKLSRALGWEDMATYYEKEMFNLSKLIRGEMNWDDYLAVSKENMSVLSSIIKPYTNDSGFRSRMVRQKPMADRIGRYIVGRAKFSAAE